jgi:hypothetical protein
MSRSNLPRSLGPEYDHGPMRLARWLPLIVIVQACASQSNAADRQLREHEDRIKQLTVNADRQEERILALEAALRAGPGTVRPVEEAKAARPDLPVVKVLPNGQQVESSADPPIASEGVGEDPRRLTIVGEGSRVEARAANEPPSPARRSTPANSRASKGNQASSPSASTGSVSQ